MTASALPTPRKISTEQRRSELFQAANIRAMERLAKLYPQAMRTFRAEALREVCAEHGLRKL